jgi:hypothetical protein
MRCIDGTYPPPDSARPIQPNPPRLVPDVVLAAGLELSELALEEKSAEPWPDDE